MAASSDYYAAIISRLPAARRGMAWAKRRCLDAGSMHSRQYTGTWWHLVLIHTCRPLLLRRLLAAQFVLCRIINTLYHFSYSCSAYSRLLKRVPIFAAYFRLLIA